MPIFTTFLMNSHLRKAEAKPERDVQSAWDSKTDNTDNAYLEVVSKFLEIYTFFCYLFFFLLSDRSDNNMLWGGQRVVNIDFDKNDSLTILPVGVLGAY